MSKWDGYQGFDSEKWDMKYGKGKYAPKNNTGIIVIGMMAAAIWGALLAALWPY